MQKFRRLRQRFALAILKPINTAAIIILGFYTFLWGVWLVVPFWSVFESATLYSTMAWIAPEWVWGLIAIATGLVMIHGVLKNAFKELLRAAHVGFFHWLMISILYFEADYQNTGGITALMLAVYCAFIFVNIKTNKDRLDYTPMK